MAFRRTRLGSIAQQEGSGGEDLNLIPIMNLFACLIPFLLLGAAFFHVSVINASVPALQGGKSDLARTEDAVTPVVQILESGFRVTASSETLGSRELEALRAEVPRQGGSLDFAGLAGRLLACKQKYPRSDTLILVPHTSVLYEEVVHTMDAARWRPEADAEGKKARTDLFPNVVISGML